MGAAIVSVLVSVLERIEEGVWRAGGLPDDRLQRVLSIIDDCLTQQESAVSKIRASFVDLIRDRVLPERPLTKRRLKFLTLSSSSTISSCLLPLCKGVTLASKLLTEAGNEKRIIDITLYSDASAALASEDVDLVLLGADRISSVGDVSNKTGSLPAVLSAKHASPGSCVVVLTEVGKVARPGKASEHVVEEKDAAELTRGWRGTVKGADDVLETSSYSKQATEKGDENKALVKVKNVYFEWVPACFIDAYVTDEGV
ncbi:translation initiation factor eIF-2B subunit family protein [Apiospora phragmitis]|uniref:Translation initiation factor eIF-2B subunit family protein n=1 Tax=Apiospora phragmitis TaxID=2905665 RepID=A0ABR1VEC4_9PEZI